MQFFRIKIIPFENDLALVGELMLCAATHESLVRSSKKTEQEKNESEKFLIGLLAGFELIFYETFSYYEMPYKHPLQCTKKF